MSRGFLARGRFTADKFETSSTTTVVVVGIKWSTTTTVVVGIERVTTTTVVVGIKWVKILNGYENIDSNIFVEVRESKKTRGHNFTLVKKQSRLDVRKFSFSQRTINVWNKLSTECVHASSVNMFKNRI